MTQVSDLPLSVAHYQSGALRTDQGSDGGSLAFPLLGLFGEVGSLLSEVKKKQRDKTAYIGYQGSVEEELGDVLWYFTVFAARAGTSLEDIVAQTIVPTHSTTALDFTIIQPSLAEADQEPTPSFEDTLLRLAGAVGALVTGVQSGDLAKDKSALKAALIEIFRTMVQAADDASVRMNRAARRNLRKTADRWPEKKDYPRPFDEDIDSAEQIPRLLTIEIFEREVGGKLYVYQRCNEINIGDRLTDNALEADDYRFHDVFHYAYATILAWSPVMRALFRLKRKSVPALDDGEDGARAILTEEGVSAWIFEFARKLDWFAGMEAGDLSFDMLKSVRQFVGPYEVSKAPLWLWEEAILSGYGAFRFLQENRRARLHLDMNKRKMTWEPLPQ